MASQVTVANPPQGSVGGQKRTIPSLPKEPLESIQFLSYLRKPKGLSECDLFRAKRKRTKKAAPRRMLVCGDAFPNDVTLKLCLLEAMSAPFRTFLSKWEKPREGVWSFRMRRVKFQSNMWGRYLIIVANLKGGSLLLGLLKEYFWNFSYRLLVWTEWHFMLESNIKQEKTMKNA